MPLLDGVRHWMRRRARPATRCSACGYDGGAERRLLAGPGVYLCEPCARDGSAHAAEAAEAADISATLARCRFCDHLRAPVTLTDARTPLHVCAPCVRLMIEIFDEDDARRGPTA